MWKFDTSPIFRWIVNNWKTSKRWVRAPECLVWLLTTKEWEVSLQFFSRSTDSACKRHERILTYRVYRTKLYALRLCRKYGQMRYCCWRWFSVDWFLSKSRWPRSRSTHRSKAPAMTWWVQHLFSQTSEAQIPDLPVILMADDSSLSRGLLPLLT